MPTVLAVDCGFTTGWGAISDDAPPRAGSFGIAGDSGRMGVALLSFVEKMIPVIKAIAPDFVVSAAPFISRLANPVQIRPIMAFPSRLQEMCQVCSIPYREFAEGDARVFFLRPGKVPRKSKDIKLAVKQGCANRGWPARDSHSCDALCVADYAHSVLFPQSHHHERLPLFTSRKPKQKDAAPYEPRRYR